MKNKVVFSCLLFFIVIWTTAYCAQAAELSTDFLYGNTDAYYRLKGDELHDASATLKIKGKKFSSKLFSIIQEDIIYYIPIKGVYRVGTKFKLTISGKNENEEVVSYSAVGTVVKPHVRCSWNYLIKGDKKFIFNISNAHAGDVLNLKIGKKVYKKKLKKNINQKRYTVKIKKAKAGAKVSVIVKNKFKQNIFKSKTLVYKSAGFKYGATMKQIKWVASFRYPVKSVSTTLGTYWYYDRNRDGYCESWILFDRGKAKRWRIYN